MQRHSRAFTLIELLVVIAIIGVMLGMLLPVMGQVRDHARKVVCAGLLRQVGTSIGAYTVDANEHLPFVISALYELEGDPDNTFDNLKWNADPTDASAHPHELLTVLKPYLSNMPEMVCPAAAVGYPIHNPKMTYRTAAANNHDGLVGPETIFDSQGNPKYGYSLKYLNGRRWELKHIDATTPLFPLKDGPGHYYLVRDLVNKADNGDRIFPHEETVNQLYLDLHVSLYKEQDIMPVATP